MDKTKIDWCDSTWNPVTGCLYGCEYCYARNIAHRFGGFTELEDTDLDYEKICGSNIVEIKKPLKYINYKGNAVKSPYPFFFKPTLYRYKLNEPKKWKKGRNIFVCSMADLFGSWVPDSWIEEVFSACDKVPQHNYLFLTKNVERYCELKCGLPDGDNMWYGTSVTKESEVSRFNSLPAFHKTFVSIEPILQDLEIRNHNVMFSQIDWVIIGAETGRRKNKVVPERKWIEDIVNECRNAYYPVPVFMKSSLADIWGEPLIQEFPKELQKEGKINV